MAWLAFLLKMKRFCWTGVLAASHYGLVLLNRPHIPLTPFMYDQLAPVHWIMKQVIKVSDARPSILPSLPFNAAIRLLCPNLAHQMASFTVNWQYVAALVLHLNLDLYLSSRGKKYFFNYNLTRVLTLIDVLTSYYMELEQKIIFKWFKNNCGNLQHVPFW